MRSNFVGLFLLSFLLVLIAGSAFLPAGAQTIEGSAHFDPDKYYLSSIGFGVAVVKAEIRFPSGKGPTTKDINASTILLEGSVPPDTAYNITGGLVAEFDADMAESVLLAKIAHLAGTLGPPYKVWLIITGNLKATAGGTPFTASGYIRIVLPRSPGPP